MNRLKLGKQPHKPDVRDLALKDYVSTSKLPPIPVNFGYDAVYPKTGWGMLGNDEVGDCTCAGSDHEIMLMTAAAGKAASFTTAGAIRDYSAITGYNPSDPNTDQGAQVRDVLKYRAATGMIDATGKRHKIGAYLSLRPGSLTDLYHACYLLESVGLGIEFPETAMQQFNDHQMWSVVEGAQIEGGHYIPLIAKRTHLEVVTWGSLQQMSVAFYAKYCDEAWCYVSADALNGSTNLSARGLNLDQLNADLAAL